LATNVVMPALGMAQETGKLLQWLKAEGEGVKKGELLMQIETDKVTVEIEAPASGVLANVTAAPGAEVRVGQVIARIVAPGESAPAASTPPPLVVSQAPTHAPRLNAAAPISITPVASRIAAENKIDLAQIKPHGNRIEKADVLSHLQERSSNLSISPLGRENRAEDHLVPASPKARRVAGERGIDLRSLEGSGPGGAVLNGDVPTSTYRPTSALPPSTSEEVGTVWRVMAERTTASWTSVPHFYLVRDALAGGMVEMRERIIPSVEQRAGIKPTYSDLLIKIIATALRAHPRLNASWRDRGIHTNPEINLSLATATEAGLVVPVIHRADELSIGDIATARRDLVERAIAGKLRPDDIAGGTFTLTNLGMYNVDAFNAIINAPQAATLAVGRIADRVVPIDGQPAVRPTVILTLSCDHRVVDGARAAMFLDDLANLIQEPWGLLA
jgi:pyruvate dehydrogenase E2 component (dihydrolipoyllysine-residue acetyltransferase)